MFDWTQAALSLLRRKQAFCLVTIIASKGSVPRNTGTKMLVTKDKAYGTIGGGNLEQNAIGQAKQYLIAKRGAPITRDYILGPELAQCCGGSLSLTFERLTNEAQITKKTNAQFTPLVIFGAGHVGTAIVNATAPLPFLLHWHDSRPEKSSSVISLLDDPILHVKNAPKNALFLVVTHDHDLDYQLVREIVQRGDILYCGMIGSQTKRARFVSRLGKDGVSKTAISRFTCPIGIGGIKGKQPEIIAASVAAQLLQIIGDTR